MNNNYKLTTQTLLASWASAVLRPTASFPEFPRDFLKTKRALYCQYEASKKLSNKTNSFLCQWKTLEIQNSKTTMSQQYPSQLMATSKVPRQREQKLISFDLHCLVSQIFGNHPTNHVVYCMTLSHKMILFHILSRLSMKNVSQMSYSLNYSGLRFAVLCNTLEKVHNRILCYVQMNFDG